jgi:hypothetical protein
MRAPFSNRRSFLGSLASFAGVAAGGPGLFVAVGSPAVPHPSASAPWDLTWLDALKGKHKQVFAVGSMQGHRPLHVVANYLDAHREVYGLNYPDVNTLVGITRDGFPINASDALWVTYDIGRHFEIKDPQTNTWATRNIFLENMPAPPGKTVGVRLLQARGTIFWQCNNALGGVVNELAASTGKPADTVRAELIAGLNPGVRLVPAHTMLLGLAQEHGCSYEQIG